MKVQCKRGSKLPHLTLLAAFIWLIFCIAAFSNAGTNVLIALVAIPVALIWGTTWLVRLVVSLRNRGHDGAKIQHSLCYWLFEPVVIILPLILAQLGVFSIARFALSEQALSNYAEQVRSGNVNLAFEFNHPPRQVGLYSVTFTDLLPDGTVRVLTSSHGLLDRAGFANSPQTPPPRRGEDFYKHIHQQWWYWYESW